MKPGKEYELFIKDVYECLNRADGLTDVEFQHDVKLTGLSGVPRQIDIFWSFKRAGIPYKVAIECKDYNKRVSLDRVSAFHDVLNDLQDVHGIIATKVGFQSGAKEWAEKYGIQARIIRHPIDEDWEGRVRNIFIQMNLNFLDNIRLQLVVNKEKAGNMELLDGFHGSGENTVTYDEMTDLSGKKYTAGFSTMQDLINMLPREYEASQDCRYSYKFKNGLFEEKYPIDEIVFTYDINISNREYGLCGDDMIKAIVKDVTEGAETIVDKFGRVSERIK